ncbi:MAG: DNA polymerase IV [Candidatus Omnitrophota bacterium]|nr:DNA polymerase IV [Candidatus Omnitrophota bacterium]
MILHIDMDAFFASIEQAINPKLKGKPLIVGSRNNKLYTVVCAASYEAKAYGIDSGMPTKKAFKLCPNLEFVAADQGKYIWTSEQIFELLKGYGFEVVYASIDEFQMDVADTLNPKSLAQTIQKQIHEAFKITASIGIAGNSPLAKLASKLNKPNGIAILTQDNLEKALAGIPVKKLCGVGEKTGFLFEGLGIKTCLDLYQKSPQFLEQNLDQNGLNIYMNLHSTDRFNTLQEDSKTKSIGHSYTLPRASENTGFIKAWIRLLSEMVGRRLREKNMAAKTVHLWLSGPEMPNFGAQKTYKETTNDSYEVYLRCLKIMARIGKKMPRIRALGVTCSNLFPVNCPPLLKEEKRREDLVKALDSINSRLGEWSIYPAVITLAKKARQ